MKRCFWANPENALYLKYHDEEWGVPVHDDRLFFEMITLEGAQAGLSWETVLKKRENYRKAFANFDVVKVSKFTAKKETQLLLDPGIIRNRLKVSSTVTNAQAFMAIQKEFGSFDKYVWRFVGGKPLIKSRKNSIPARTPESDTLSLDLKKRGFRFVGTTICYAFMQATGLVNDHTVDCFRAKKVKRNVLDVPPR